MGTHSRLVEECEIACEEPPRRYVKLGTRVIGRETLSLHHYVIVFFIQLLA